MEAEKLLEQNGFSKFYESKNVVGFASMRDRLKFYEDTQTICLCDEHYEVSFSPNIIKAIYLYCGSLLIVLVVKLKIFKIT